MVLSASSSGKDTITEAGIRYWQFHWTHRPRFIWGLSRETGPSGAFEGTDCNGTSQNRRKVDIKGDIQKQRRSDKSYRRKKP